jgi:hypothetical protein
MRLLLTGVIVALALFFGSVLVGRALDHEAQQRVIFTKHGETLDCNRTEGAGGEVFYDHCVSVP